MRGKSKSSQSEDTATRPGQGTPREPASSGASAGGVDGADGSSAAAGQGTGAAAGEVIDAEVVEPATPETGAAAAGGADGATAEGATVDAEAVAAGTVEGEAVDAGTVEGETIDGEPVEGEVIDATVIETEPVAPGAVLDNAIGAELGALRSDLDEMTRDLQRVSAEYANYRRRVERDRNLVAEQAVGTVLSALLPVLDDLDRAREHGDLVGPFGSVAEQLVATVGKFGLSPFGEKGDPFDPTRHEAVAHQTSEDVTEPTCVEIMRRGYTLGGRLLRPALVAVAEPQ